MCNPRVIITCNTRTKAILARKMEHLMLKLRMCSRAQSSSATYILYTAIALLVYVLYASLWNYDLPINDRPCFHQLQSMKNALMRLRTNNSASGLQTQDGDGWGDSNFFLHHNVSYTTPCWCSHIFLGIGFVFKITQCTMVLHNNSTEWPENMPAGLVWGVPKVLGPVISSNHKGGQSTVDMTIFKKP